MNTVRAAVWLSYLMVAITLLSTGVAIWGRAHDPMWAQMQGSHRNFDILHGGIALLSVAVAYGIWRRREWGRIFAILLAAIVLFYSVGVQLAMPLASPDAKPTFYWDSLAVSALSIVCIVLLVSCRFGQQLPANSTPHEDAPACSVPDQPSSARAGERRR